MKVERELGLERRFTAFIYSNVYLVLAYIGRAFLECELFQKGMPREDLFILARKLNSIFLIQKHIYYGCS
jgi:hypothetical protein